MSGEQRRAAVSIVEDSKGRLLCVWNKRYQGWTLPGGMVEEGETVEQGQRRELKEETGLETVSAVQIYEGEHGLSSSRPGRASHVHVFRVEALGNLQTVDEEGTEEGCPLEWMTRHQFLERSPFAEFYRKVFDWCDVTSFVEFGRRCRGALADKGDSSLSLLSDARSFILELEWSGTWPGDPGETEPACPSCGELKPWIFKTYNHSKRVYEGEQKGGHKEDCRLVDMVRRLGVTVPEGRVLSVEPLGDDRIVDARTQMNRSMPPCAYCGDRGCFECQPTRLLSGMPCVYCNGVGGCFQSCPTRRMNLGLALEEIPPQLAGVSTAYPRVENKSRRRDRHSPRVPSAILRSGEKAMSPYRTSIAAQVVPSREFFKCFSCWIGLHKPSHFTVAKSRRFICAGVAVRIFCDCGRCLFERHRPTKRPVHISVSSNWDGMGA